MKKRSVVKEAQFVKEPLNIEKTKKSDFFNNIFLKDVKEFNAIFLMLIGAFLVSISGYSSYAIFSDEIVSDNEIKGIVVGKYIEPNPPLLSENMIPVYYDNTDTSWHKADESNQNEQYKWYDYKNKMWANAVTVKSANRSTYKSAALGTKIEDTDINTMFVWIPRYKYRVWNYNNWGNTASNPQEIKITFESGKNKSGNITCTDEITGTIGGVSETCKINNVSCSEETCDGKTYTHPAFTLGSTELTGIWVGKFETTGTISAITIRPNETSLKNQTISSFFTNIAKMKNSGNAYGFAATDDTHMMKNMEWGAVAYLYHSKYGICTAGTCTEATVNNNTSYKTGGDDYIANIDQTTTGNIYGIYDMSGGTFEYILGNAVDASGQFNVASAGTFSPEEKYYDKYSYGEVNFGSIAIQRGKLGDAIKEVLSGDKYSWYKDFGYIPTLERPWLRRGGSYNNNTNAGLFTSDYANGAKYSNHSTRIVISIP